MNGLKMRGKAVLDGYYTAMNTHQMDNILPYLSADVCVTFPDSSRNWRTTKLAREKFGGWFKSSPDVVSVYTLSTEPKHVASPSSADGPPSTPPSSPAKRHKSANKSNDKGKDKDRISDNDKDKDNDHNSKKNDNDDNNNDDNDDNTQTEGEKHSGQDATDDAGNATNNASNDDNGKGLWEVRITAKFTSSGKVSEREMRYLIDTGAAKIVQIDHL